VQGLIFLIGLAILSDIFIGFIKKMRDFLDGKAFNTKKMAVRLRGIFRAGCHKGAL